MKMPLELDLNKYSKETEVINLNPYSIQTYNPQDYLLAFEFGKINPIVEKIENQIDKKLGKNERTEEENTQNNFRSSPSKLEVLLNSTNPIIVLPFYENKSFSTPEIENKYQTQNFVQNKGLAYKIGQNRYHRQFVWYDEPVRIGFSLPQYYRRH